MLVNRLKKMALKLDMEHAYDSMGWSTLHQVLKWYGFPTLFSNLLMECVVDVMFSIIINGRNSNWIGSKSGFRQGCPLSPYLFILCSQLLSNSLEQRGKNLGIPISPRGPRISHLLYANDVLILSHVSTTLAKELKTIVEDFCKWTGQRVNINKSQVLFGKMVSYSLKKKITRIIGFKEVKEMKYLGVKVSLRRNKVADFQELLSLVMDKLNSWGKKSLSMGGKITLIETSLLSMPNFLITHSLVPKRVLYEIEKLCRSFLRHKSDGAKGMHYVAWSEICKPRNMGGLGLQSPLLRIGVLRSRLAWNFIQKKDSLLHRTMKPKYGDEIMKDDHKTITSTAWKILLDVGRNLKKAIR
ncbi:Putative ribonuclease H protein [Dendrobium catenatum]|uniref:Ribonuclease H protein n=1 Tax=Dendrobium catenatum TaxID=906689 RepID=A0A2I0VXD8_9ASPA|nr:Putative ribonuclease H protein [Dendrobium catenatum]